MEIEAKWKDFALCQILSDHSADDPVELFDRIAEANGDNSELKVIFVEFDVNVWQPFENYPESYVADQIVKLAEVAQETASRKD